MSNLSPPLLLVISDGSVPYEPPANMEVLHLHYGFSVGASPDGFAAWWQGDTSLAVAESCRGLKGGFRQQALNRLVAQYLLKNAVQGVVIVGLYGCTLDLPRIISLIKLPVAWVIQPAAASLLLEMDNASHSCLVDALDKTLAVNDEVAVLTGQQLPGGAAVSLAQLHHALQSSMAATKTKTAASAYDYSLYEFSLRDHPLLSAMQQADTAHFKDCQRVLDLGCGVGIFLALLREAGIPGVGVERNPAIADYGRGMGLDIITEDAVAFVAQTRERFDGIYCSHFLEHLPIELVQQLLANLARVMSDNGVAVLAFPDPESIRSQLLGFWRDPEHVRFYHPELIMSLAQAVGLDCEWSSYQDQPHHIVPFSVAPPPLPDLLSLPSFPSSATAKDTCSLIQRLLSRLGLACGSQLLALQTQLDTWKQTLTQQQRVIARQQQVISQLSQRTDQLWAVNNTWAWNDNAVLKLRRRKRCS